MSNIDYIISLCHDIQQQGKTPSVALIRSSSTSTLPIPDVIKAIKQWKANPEHRPKIQASFNPNKASTPKLLEQRISQLEQQLAYVLEEMTVLKSKIN